MAEQTLSRLLMEKNRENAEQAEQIKNLKDRLRETERQLAQQIQYNSAKETHVCTGISQDLLSKLMSHNAHLKKSLT